jgi:CRP-like cAMP-binding protein
MSLELQELLAYISSGLLVSTFYMKTMIPLRVTAIAANICLIVFTAATGLYPALVIQAFALPLNVWRLVQIQRSTRRIRQAARDDLNLDALARFMKHEHAIADTVLFETGDESHKMYMIKEGRVRLEGVGRTLGPGDVFGEIGIVAPDNRRTATAICEQDCELLTITRDEVSRLYYVDPGFGWYLIRLITARLLHNLKNAGGQGQSLSSESM